VRKRVLALEALYADVPKVRHAPAARRRVADAAG
jgi:hypothetical protein